MIQDHSFRQSFYTVQLVPLTAFDSSGRLELDVMQRQTERLLAAGVKVFIPCAGSSEFHSLEADEIVAAVRMTRRVVGQHARVVVPVGLQLNYAITLARRAVDAGADAMLVMPLTFPYISNSGARDYYAALLDAVKYAALIYKKDAVPSHELLLELAEHPQVLGVKYSLADISGFQQVVQQDRGRLDWFCGHAERYAPYFALAGAVGYTSGAGNVCPRVTLALQQALATGDFGGALHWQRIILPIEEFRARDANSYNVSFLKYAMRHAGFEYGQPRPPYRRLTPAEMAEIDSLIRPILTAEAELER
jgi:4-hydroxy-tetrahydrodipicolinate synthase